MKLRLPRSPVAARRARRPEATGEPSGEDLKQRQLLLKLIASGISANKFPPR